MEGIQFIIDANGNRQSVVIDLKLIEERPDDVQDFLDLLVVESRKDDELVDWETAKAELMNAGKL